MKRYRQKKTILVMLALLLCSASYGQHNQGSWAVSLATGIRSGGITWDGPKTNISAGIEYFLTRNQSLVAGVSETHLQRPVENSPLKGQFTQQGVGLHYNYTFYRYQLLESKTWFYLYGTLGGEYTHEHLTNQVALPDYLILDYTQQNLLGADLGIGSELNFTRHISLFGNLIPRWEFTNKEFVMQANIGLKLYF